MPPFVVEPGTRLVDRYRLEEPLGESGPTSYWRALDELLDRPVGICLLREDDYQRGEPDADTVAAHEASPADQVLAAARRAAAVTDPRFLRVLDASESDDLIYVVTEWVKANSLTDLLADGPMLPEDARHLAAQTAQALTSAHREGLAHLCLTPDHVLRTANGQIKVAGLAVDAAVRGLRSASPTEAARRDTEGCAAVLYAALTARWPGPGPSTLPSAPRENGLLCSPRQVRAGIPDDLDDIATRVLVTRHRSGTDPLNTPGALVKVLAAAHATTRIPVVASGRRPVREVPPPYPGYVAPYEDDTRRRSRVARVARAAWVLAALALLVGIVLVGYQLIPNLGNGRSGSGSSPLASANAKPKPTRAAIKVASVSAFDPPPDGNGEENNARAGLVIDGDSATSWNTKRYKQEFGPGGIKRGVGLVLDLGRARSVGSVSVSLLGQGTDVELRASANQGATVKDFRRVAAVADSASGLAELRPATPVSARYLLVWFTGLPNAGNGYLGVINEITVRG